MTIDDLKTILQHAYSEQDAFVLGIQGCVLERTPNWSDLPGNLVGFPCKYIRVRYRIGQSIRFTQAFVLRKVAVCDIQPGELGYLVPLQA